MKNLSEYLIENTIVKMANSKSEFEKLVYNLFEQIIENWCLVKLCDLYPKESFSINRNHWCSELKSYINRIYRFKIKSNNNHRYKYIYNIFVNSYELNDKNEVADIIRRKFTKGGLQKYINIISEECANSIETICRVLASDNINTIDDYVDGEIG